MRQYQELLKRIMQTGEDHADRTGVGTKSVFGHQMRFDLRPGGEFPLVTTKKVPYRWVAEELLWILSGSTDERKLSEKGVDIWKEWAGEDGDLGPTYGFQLRSFGADYEAQNLGRRKDGFDQVRWLCNELWGGSNSRRLILTYWNPRQLNNGFGVFPPCHVAAQFKVHEGGGLSALLFQRSADAFLGLPFDIASYATLTILLAEVCALYPRELVVSIGDAHVYNSHLEQVETILHRTPRPGPRLDLLDPLKNIRGAGFDGLMRVRAESLELTGYDPHGKVDAPVAV